jgi:NAD(P)-dependent dehydrogenase (short-subunit alcohol dehydrogenase family)
VKDGTVVITGASAGVGRATAREFARRGARIGLIARGRERLDQTAREIGLLGGSALALPCDVSDPAQVERAADEVEKKFGPIDIWVNNAMVSVLSPFVEMTPEEFTRVTEVTYLGYVYSTLSALRRMIPRDRGTIVQVGSTLAYRAIPLQSAYCGAKHAIRGFTDSIRSELYHSRSKVHMTMVQLPALNTPQFDWIRTRMPRQPQPVPPIYEPEVAAKAIGWAAHHRRRELFVGFTASVFIWGNKFFPGIGDRCLGFTGYDSQQTQENIDSRRPDNLFEPVQGDFAARGRFGSARESSRQLWLAMHPEVGFLALAGICAAGKALCSLMRGTLWRKGSGTTRS